MLQLRVENLLRRESALLATCIKMNANGYLVTDEKCETNIAGIFAIGDLREEYARQIVLSAGDGRTSALASAHNVELKRAMSAA